MDYRPTREEIANAANKTVDDVIAPNLCILFCGINPGLYTAAVGHHFAHPSNRFWKILYKAGFTDRLLSPNEEKLLLERNIGITNLVRRATSKAGDLKNEEYASGRMELENKIMRYGPRNIVFLGMESYKKAYCVKKLKLGKQVNKLIGTTEVWVLPNPSGLNASYKPDNFVKEFAELRNQIKC